MKKYIITGAAFVLAFVAASFAEENDTLPDNTAGNCQPAVIAFV